jgi:hypothetical protein
VSKMGWCMTGQHDGCRVEYMDWMNAYRRCECKCHPAVDEAHVAEFSALHERTVQVPDLVKGRRRSTKVVAAPKVKSTRAATTTRKRNVQAEAEAMAATEAALAAVESDEAVLERMAEVMEEA